MSYQLSREEFLDRYRLMREQDRKEWRLHWKTIVLSSFVELLGSFAFGFCLGLAIALQVLISFLANY